MSESQIRHITRCVLCGTRPKVFGIDTPAFETIPPVGPIGARALEFGRKLFMHIADEGSREETSLKTGPPPNLSSIDEAAAFMATQAPHSAMFKTIGQLAEWAQRFALLAVYSTTDPELIKNRESARYALHKATTDSEAAPNDLKLAEIVECTLENLASLETQAEKTYLLTSVLKELRDHILYPPAPDGMQAITSLVQPASAADVSRLTR